jgi:hypothetical protein
MKEFLGLGREDLASGLPGLSLEALPRLVRRRLLVTARWLGLTALHRLSANAIAEQALAAVRGLLAPLGAAPPEPDTPNVTRADGRETSHKFDLGRPPDRGAEVRHIPWGYGRDRITAMVVDPDRLYVYWEVTDEAIERARAGLGAAGRDAWLNLRVYDVTNRIFDGTNAHGYFDQRVERTDRQWFFTIGRPASTVCVEIGMKSTEGYFVRIARSGRADFPPRGPVADGPVEWLTVRTPTGEVGEPVVGAPVPPPFGAERARAAPPESLRAWDIRRSHGGAPVEHRWQWEETLRREWTLGPYALSWEGPAVRTAWEAGPFSFPIELPAAVEERHEGGVRLEVEEGRTRLVYGPWRVIIRNLGARAERRILAIWEVSRSWLVRGGTAETIASGPAPRAGGSERLAGASAERWAAASELRLGGASELYRLGASERRYAGASELVYGGASEWRLAGASETRLAAASETRLGVRLGGASERR